MGNKIGLVAELTKQQTDRAYFSELPVGTKFIIVEEHEDFGDYELTGYFIKTPPQDFGNGIFHYTGYIEKGSWRVLGSISECIDIFRSF